MTDMKTVMSDNRLRLGAVVVLIALALFGVFRYSAAARANAQATATTNGVNGATPATGGTVRSPAASGGCCSIGGGSTTPIEGTAPLTGGIQKISVTVGPSGYNPNVIKLKAGVPAEIPFSQSQGCTGYVQSQDLNFAEDLTSGPKTVKLSGLQPGTYIFECGMGMVTGQIVVE